MSNDNTAQASLESLYKIFTVPETPDSTLAKLDREISDNLLGFLRDRIVAVEKDITEIEKDFSNSRIPEQPRFVSDHTEFLLDSLVAHSVHTTAPSFIGHMTSALPYFMLPLSKIMLALNQNLVKIETSKAFTPLERELLGMMHRLVYGCEDTFYNQWMHQSDHALGAVCSGGTLANITALWAARNNAFPPDDNFTGIQQEGLPCALQHYGYRGAAILVSELGHYSLSKAADLLGIGRKNLIAIETDTHYRVNTRLLQQRCQQLKRENIKVIAIIGIAGTTETGSIDPLQRLGEIAQQEACHYHVDAAWGGPTLFSNNHAPRLQGIARADSVTIDAHKQMYTPLSCGMVLFKNPWAVRTIEHHAEYIIRKGSKDLGATSLEGSRSGAALLIHAGLHIIGRQGYQLLIDQGIHKARYFADLVDRDSNFELISAPQLNILTYRLVPARMQLLLHQATPECHYAANQAINRLTVLIQKVQRERGKTFVSRTTLQPASRDRQRTTVFRVVLANPLTTEQILQAVLREQWEIAQEPEAQMLIDEAYNALTNCSDVGHSSQ